VLRFTAPWLNIARQRDLARSWDLGLSELSTRLPGIISLVLAVPCDCVNYRRRRHLLPNGSIYGGYVIQCASHHCAWFDLMISWALRHQVQRNHTDTLPGTIDEYTTTAGTRGISKKLPQLEPRG